MKLSAETIVEKNYRAVGIGDDIAFPFVLLKFPGAKVLLTKVLLRIALP